MSNGATAPIATRRPRFRRASESPAFRVTEDDIEIVRQIAQHRFLRSNHIAALVGRSIDRTNDRLCNLYHAGYIDRPSAQLDYYPAGSAPIVYALGLASGARRNFLVEIDRGSMPITRSDFSQTSIERKLRCYLAANAVRLPERQFEWKAVFAELFP